jgi:hypothetical protein
VLAKLWSLFKRMKLPGSVHRVAASSSEASDEAREKASLEQKLHDQRAWLHVIEWQADVRGRRPTDEDESHE